MTLAACLLCAVFAVDPLNDNHPADAFLTMQWAALPDEVREMTTLIERGCNTDASMDLRYQAKNAWETLLKQGDHGALALISLSRSTQNKGLRSAVIGTLCATFGSYPWVKEYILTEGLHSSESFIGYTCLYCVGEQRWDEAHNLLLAKMQGRHEEDQHRFAAAKSLAQLGDLRSLPTLIEAALHRDYYYSRRCGNIGLAALTGKSLNDFNYQDREGVNLSGGVEIRDGRFDAVKELKTRLRRHAACHEYLKWLQEERPALYAALAENF